MNKMAQETVKQNSTKEHCLNNGTFDIQSDWSRCNSFSSSSNDSAVFCASHLQKPNFPTGKQFSSKKQRLERNRNSSGSSASSNISCLSDKDIKKMPVLTTDPPLNENSAINIGNLTNYSNITPTLALQHEALLNNRLSHSIDMGAVLPFRHNLRRNIRKKTCSCDCTATCTTVVVSRQYKGIGEGVEEETVISRTKVKTYVERNHTEISPERNVHISSSIPFQEKASLKHESIRKRRSEIEKLYDSLHEIKWAKNFSPDNILRQFDVRQAASCSAFGRSPEDKPEGRTPKRRKYSDCQDSKSFFRNAEDHAKLNKPFKRSDNRSCRIHSKSHTTRSSTANSNCLNVDRSPPVLEKSVNNGNVLDVENGHYSTYPILSKETPEKVSGPWLISRNNFECPADKTNCSSCNNIIPKKFLSFDFESNMEKTIENITDCAPPFFDIAKEETFDTCFPGVAAEVVVSTCYETKYGLPLLTSSEEACHMSKKITQDCPPVLEPLLSKGKSFDQPLLENNLPDVLNFTQADRDLCCAPPPLYFFPLLDSKLLPERDYSPPPACFEDHPFPDISSELKQNLPHLTFVKELPEALNESPPISCINGSAQEVSSEASSYNKIDEPYFDTHIEVKAPKLLRHCESVDSTTLNDGLLTKSLIRAAGRRIFNKYLKYLYSKTKKQCLPLNFHEKLKEDGSKKDSTIFLSTSNNLNGLSYLNENSPIRTAVSHDYYEPPSESLQSLQRTSVEKYKDDISCRTSDTFLSIESHEQTSETVESIEDSTVIRTFNQKLSYSTSPEKITLNHTRNSSSFFFQSSPNPVKYSSMTTNSLKKSFINNGHHSETLTSSSGCAKIPPNNEEKEYVSLEDVKVPSRVFTCHYQTINVTHGTNYIQIVLKVNRGKSIFLTHESLVELKEAISRASKDKDCRLLILNGFGQTFCLGLDLRPFLEPDKKQAVVEVANAVRELIVTLSSFYKPLVAIVNGAAYGLGMTLLTHADVTLATDNASFCMPYPKLGYMPEGGATLTLPQAVGATMAMDMMLRGQVLTAQQARNIGLVNEVVEVHHLPQDLVSRVKTMAETSISAMETTKAMIKLPLHNLLTAVLENEAKLLPQMWLTTSCQEAIQSAFQSGIFADC